MSCDSWPASDLPAWEERARDALFEEDVERFRELWADLAEALPCAQGPVAPEPWAKLLLDLAVYEYANGLAWVEPLAAALRTWPEVPRDIGPPALRTFAPPAPEPSGASLPAGVRWFADGSAVQAAPPQAGIHLVQREVDGTFEGRLLRNQGLPTDWLPASSAGVASAPAGSGPGLWAVFAAGGGVGGRAQATSEANRHVPTGTTTSAVLGLATHGGVGDALVVGWDASATIQLGQVPAADAYGLLGLPVGPAVLVGGGGATTAVVAVDDTERLVVLPQPHLGARLAAGPASVVAAGGWTLAAWHAGATATARTGPDDAPGAALLAGVLAHGSRFDETGGTLALSHFRWAALVGVGGAL